MQYGGITGYMDVAQLTLYAFWIFFAGLVFYLRTEDKREGFPMISEQTGKISVEGFPPIPRPKMFRQLHGVSQTAPRREDAEVVAAKPAEGWPGAPLVPTGNPMLDGVGPAAWCLRADVPEVTFDDALPKIVPLRVATNFFLAWEDPDPRGMAVVGTDRKVAGVVKDVWIDRSETIVRFYEAEIPTAAGPRAVLIPFGLAVVNGKTRQLRVRSLKADQFAAIPAVSNPDQVTLREEERIYGYFGGGNLYATPARAEPVI